MAIGNRVLLKSRKARKGHDCDMCFNTIEAGEHYTSASAQRPKAGFVNVKACLSHRWKEIIEFVKDIE